MRRRDLERRLVSFGYVNLFMQVDESDLDGLWHESGVPDMLTQIAMDEDAKAEARFLASEILFARQPGYPPKSALSTLGRVYSRALGRVEPGNAWGLPGHLDGQAGIHLVKIGEPAVKPLLRLMGNNQPVAYWGSNEATYANRFGYRVKDLAAFFVCLIRHVPYTLYVSPAARDAIIAALAKDTRTPTP